MWSFSWEQSVKWSILPTQFIQFLYGSLGEFRLRSLGLLDCMNKCTNFCFYSNFTHLPIWAHVTTTAVLICSQNKLRTKEKQCIAIHYCISRKLNFRRQWLEFAIKLALLELCRTACYRVKLYSCVDYCHWTNSTTNLHRTKTISIQ